MITIVDYGLGNIRAFCNVYERLNIKTRTARIPSDLKNSEKIIIPGIGAFDYAMMRLNASGMKEELNEQVLNNKVPVMGICVGMQILAERSEEGVMPGLGWINGSVKKLIRKNDSMKTGQDNEDLVGLDEKISLPHMGWNDVVPVEVNSLFREMEMPRFYFLHSYYFAPNSRALIIAYTNYCGDFASAVREGNIFGVQFHPEKSHSYGVQLLKNFALL